MTEGGIVLPAGVEGGKPPEAPKEPEAEEGAEDKKTEGKRTDEEKDRVQKDMQLKDAIRTGGGKKKHKGTLEELEDMMEDVDAEQGAQKQQEEARGKGKGKFV